MGAKRSNPDCRYSLSSLLSANLSGPPELLVSCSSSYPGWVNVLLFLSFLSFINAAFTAIRYSQVLTLDSPRNLWKLR